MDELELVWCEDISDSGLRHIAARCTNLKNLQLKHRILSRETLLEIADNCSEMETLHLSAVSCVTNDIVESLALKMVNIDTLDLSWNNGREFHATFRLLFIFTPRFNNFAIKNIFCCKSPSRLHTSL